MSGTLLGIADADVINADLPDQVNGLSERDELKRLDALRGELDRQRKPYTTKWADAADYVRPDAYYRDGKQLNDGLKSKGRINNPAPAFALNILTAGMFSGTANPSTQWFGLDHPDPDINENSSVKEYLSDAEDRMRNVLIKSNFYLALPRMIRSMAQFGVGCMIGVEDADDVVRFHNRMVGQYWVSQDERGIVGTYMDEQIYTVRQLVQTFGLKNVGRDVRQMWNDGNKEASKKVLWCVERNPDFKPGRLEAKHMRYRSTYWIKGNTTDGLLSVSGMDVFSPIVGRWDSNGMDPYGFGPGTDAIPTYKSLNKAEVQLHLAREYNVKPMWRLSTALRGQTKLFIPGGHFYGEEGDAEPVFKSQLPESGVIDSIQTYVETINNFFSVPLFLMASQNMINRDGGGFPTATQVQAQKQEQMLALGPVLQNLNDEVYDRVIDFVFDAMERAGRLPDPPEILGGQNLRVEYRSILSNAQKANDITSMDRWLGSVAQLAEIVGPDVLDLLPADATARRYHDLLGQHPDTIANQEDVERIRAQRQQQIAEQQEVDRLQQISQTGKTLSDTSLEDNNALAQILTGGQVV